MNHYPENHRKQFDTAKMNTRVNTQEEASRDSSYEDNAYIPKVDPRSANVVSKINAGSVYATVDDDYVSRSILKQGVPLGEDSLATKVDTMESDLEKLEFDLADIDSEVEDIGNRVTALETPEVE